MSKWSFLIAIPCLTLALVGCGPAESDFTPVEEDPSEIRDESTYGGEGSAPVAPGADGAAPAGGEAAGTPE